ncbi:MAG: 30S ribosomal protein S8 [Candidatus Pacebacteria bacterium]|nr:30S ribosomal protein S8 [Candidatus Paceibacterota bacterium]
MSLSDPISDMLTRIRNASMVGKPTVSIPASKLKSAIAEVLKNNGYIADHRVEDGDAKKVLVIDLKYYGDAPVIEGLQRVSKPSCRVYVKGTDIPRVLGGLGVAILSTSKGVLGDRAARRENIGGEVLCYVW